MIRARPVQDSGRSTWLSWKSARRPCAHAAYLTLTSIMDGEIAFSGIDMSMYPQLELQNSHRSVSRGVAETAPNFFLPIEVARAFGRLTLVGEVGYQYSSGQANEGVAGVLAAFEVSPAFELLVEVRSISTTFLRDGDVIINAGLRRALGARVKLLAAAGSGLRNGPETT